MGSIRKKCNSWGQGEIVGLHLFEPWWVNLIDFIFSLFSGFAGGFMGEVSARGRWIYIPLPLFAGFRGVLYGITWEVLSARYMYIGCNTWDNNISSSSLDARYIHRYVPPAIYINFNTSDYYTPFSPVSNVCNTVLCEKSCPESHVTLIYFLLPIFPVPETC